MSNRVFAGTAIVCRNLLLVALTTAIVGCASSGESGPGAAEQAAAMEAQHAEQLAEARAAEERARIARMEQERQSAAREEAARQAQQKAEAAARAEREARAQAVAAQERAAQAAEAAQQAKIRDLEAQIAATRANAENLAAANSRLEAAIATAEELLEVLAAEQLKYGNTDASGQTTEQLQKGLIADLEARKNSLKQEAQALAQ